AFIGKPFNVEILRKTLLNLLEAQVRLRNSFSGQQLPTEQITTPELQSPDERLLQKIIKVINENLSNSDLTTDYIASKVGLSRVHLYRKLKELTNQSARSYIRNIRLAKAAELLSQKKMSVAEVAYLTGFNNANNFSTIFHDLYGMSPKEYMERNSKEETPSNPTE
ncbi:MAG: helix-turn-helix transcriptional regulator, partial [Bacteroidales bacterium]|nr:helix-turn-helix transcriptional regulator [Bacteroidales bacterium]